MIRPTTGKASEEADFLFRVRHLLDSRYAQYSPLHVCSLEGLLLLSLSRGGEGGEEASLTPRARLQLPTVPIQAGFLDGELVVALPSSSSPE